MRTGRRAAASFFAIVLLLAGCGEGGKDSVAPASSEQEPQAEPMEEISIEAKDGSLVIPESVASAPTLFVLDNNGSKPYEAKFARLNDGVTLKDLKASLRQGPEAAFPLITLAGEIRRTAPGESDELTTELAPGNYVVVDPVYAARGMLDSFEVVATTQETEEPAADFEVQLSDFAIEMPTTLPAGSAIFKVVNSGRQAHEVAFLRDGEKLGRKTPGVTPFNPATTVWMEFDLEPGEYTAVCYFPDTETNKPHVALGMKTKFTVE